MHHILWALFAFCLSCGYRPVGDINTATQQVQNRLFTPKELIDIQLVSGSCRINAGPADAIHVRVVHRYGPADKFTATLSEEDNLLRLREEFFSLARSQTEWTIEAPPQTQFRIHSASGDIILTELTGPIEVESVSGNIKVRGTTGKLALKTATADIDLANCVGDITAETISGQIRLKDGHGAITAETGSGLIKAQALDGTLHFTTNSGPIKSKDLSGQLSFYSNSGDISAAALHATGPGFFDTTSGDLAIGLAQAPAAEMTLQTMSGDAVLDYGGAPISGNFSFYAQVHRGEIIAPFSFDREEQHELEGHTYQLKSFSRTDDLPQILLRTDSGRAELRP